MNDYVMERWKREQQKEEVKEATYTGLTATGFHCMRCGEKSIKNENFLFHHFGRCEEEKLFETIIT